MSEPIQERRQMIEEIESRLAQRFEQADAVVSGAGNRIDIEVISPDFADMRPVKRQQAVYATIADLIASGAIHAVTIKAMTPAEAE